MRTVAHKSYGIKNISSIEKQSRAPSLFILTGTDVNGNTRFIWFFKPNGEKVYDVYSIMSNEGLSKSEALKKAHEVLGNFKEKNISLIFDPLTIGDLKQNLLIKSNVYWFIVLDGNAYGKGYILVDFFTGKAVYSSH